MICCEFITVMTWVFGNFFPLIILFTVLFIALYFSTSLCSWIMYKGVVPVSVIILPTSVLTLLLQHINLSCV
jgi:hypothetical protein